MPEEDEDQPQPDDPANLRGQLRRTEKERNQYRAEAEAGRTAARQLAIYQAGISDQKTIKMLEKLHDGEWTPDALRETITEYGLDATSSNEEAGPDEREEAMKNLAAVGSGARGVSDTRKPTVNDDEALAEELNEFLSKNLPAKGKVENRQQYLDGLTKIMNKWQVRMS